MFGVIGFALTISVGNEPYHVDYVPVLMHRDVLEKSIRYEEAKAIQNPGKIYFKDDYIFINEQDRGVHVIDNHDPMRPQNVGFINIPGNRDMAMKGNVLYVNSSVDLVSIDVSSFERPVIKDRVVKEFPELTPPGYDYVPNEFTENSRPENTEIIRWEKRK